MPRDGGDADVAWISMDPSYAFHVVNAFDDGDRTVLDVVRYDAAFDTGPGEAIARSLAVAPPLDGRPGRQPGAGGDARRHPGRVPPDRPGRGRTPPPLRLLHPARRPTPSQPVLRGTGQVRPGPRRGRPLRPGAAPVAGRAGVRAGRRRRTTRTRAGSCPSSTTPPGTPATWSSWTPPRSPGPRSRRCTSRPGCRSASTAPGCPPTPDPGSHGVDARGPPGVTPVGLPPWEHRCASWLTPTAAGRDARSGARPATDHRPTPLHLDPRRHPHRTARPGPRAAPRPGPPDGPAGPPRVRAAAPDPSSPGPSWAARWPSPPGASCAGPRTAAPAAPAERILRVLVVLVAVLLVVAGRRRLRLLPLPVGPDRLGSVHDLRGRRQRRPLQPADHRLGQPGRRDRGRGPAVRVGPGRPPASGRTPSRSSTSTRPPARPRRCPSPGTPSSPSPACPPNSGCRPRTRSTPPSRTAPTPSIQTIENTFGIPISHYIVISFFGVEDAVNALGGISHGLPLPGPGPGLLDRAPATTTPASTSRRPAARCSTAPQALSLSRSRYYQYYADGYWHSDPTSDIGRIERQNLVIAAALDKAKSTYNPLRLNSLLSSVVHDFSQGQRPDGHRPVGPGRAVPRLLRIVAAVLHAAHRRGGVVLRRRRRGGRSPTRRPP